MDLDISTSTIRLTIGSNPDLGREMTDETSRTLARLAKGDLIPGRVIRQPNGSTAVELLNRTIPLELGSDFGNGALVTFRIKSVEGSTLELELIKSLQNEGQQFNQLLLNSLANLLAIDSKSMFEYFSNKRENLSSLETIFKVLVQVVDRDRNLESILTGVLADRQTTGNIDTLFDSISKDLTTRMKLVFEELADTIPVVNKGDLTSTTTLLERLANTVGAKSQTSLALATEIKTTLENQVKLTFGEAVASNLVKLSEQILQSENLNFLPKGNTSENFDSQLKLYFSVSDLLRSQKQSELLIDYLGSAVEYIREDNPLIAFFSSLKGFLSIQDAVKTDQITEKIFDVINKIYGQLSEARDLHIGSTEIKQIFMEFISELKSQIGEKFTLKEGVAENLIPAIRQLEQFLQTQETLNKLNPLMNALGDPSWLLLPVLLNNQLNIWNISNYEDRREQSTNKQGANNRVTINLTLTGLGDITVIINHGLTQANIEIVVENSEKAEFITKLFPKLKTSIQELGYPSVECQSRHSKQLSGINQQVRLYFEKSIIA